MALKWISVSELKQEDFKKRHLWSAKLRALNEVAPAKNIQNVEDDEPYIVSIEYILNNGEKYDGYCYIYDETGFHLFDNYGRTILISISPCCTGNEAMTLGKALELKVSSIFPIHYTSPVKIFGRELSGSIMISSSKEI